MEEQKDSRLDPNEILLWREDGTPIATRRELEIARAGHYSQLTYEELEKKIEDVLHSEEFGNPLSKEQIIEAEESWRQFELTYPLVDAPEGWEEKRRAELMATVPEGTYSINDMLWTGKGGYIDFQIAMEKSAKRYK